MGPHPQSQEVKKYQARQLAQKQSSETITDPQQSSTESKATTPSFRNQQQHHHQQPLQQIPRLKAESKTVGVSHAASISVHNRTLFVVLHIK